MIVYPQTYYSYGTYLILLESLKLSQEQDWINIHSQAVDIMHEPEGTNKEFYQGAP